VEFLEDECLGHLQCLAGFGLFLDDASLSKHTEKEGKKKEEKATNIFVDLKTKVASNGQDGGLAGRVEHPLLHLGLHGARVNED